MAPGEGTYIELQELRELTRDVTYALGNMITGSLGGLFDAPTTTRIDFDAPIQTVDPSRASSASR